MKTPPSQPFTDLLQRGSRSMQQSYPDNPRVKSRFFTKDRRGGVGDAEVAYFTSSNIKVAAYDHKRQILNVTFLSKNSVYEYYLVPPAFWDSMKRASSVGRYFYFTIRSRFAYRKIM